MANAKEADLAGPGIGSYEELERLLPDDYSPLLEPRETMEALYAAKRLIEDRLCEELSLTMVQVPLIVDLASGVNDYLDRDGSRTPVGFHISNDRDLHPIDAEVVQAATKWKRMALRQFGMSPSEGLLTDMRAVRKDLSGLQVRHFMISHPVTAHPEQTLGEFMDAVAGVARFTSYPVVRAGEVLGVLPLRRVLETTRTEWDERRVSERMVPRAEVPVLHEDDEALAALWQLDAHDLHRGLVLDDEGRLAGFVSITDIVRLLSASR